MASFPGIVRHENILRAPGYLHSNYRSDGMRVINSSGSDIPAFSIVALSGYDNVTKHQKIVLANAVTSTQNRELFVTRSIIHNGKKGTVWKSFLATGQNTNGATVGDKVYLSATSSGAFVLTTAPTSSMARIVQVGFVQVVSSTAGEIFFDIHEPDLLSSGDLQPSLMQVATGVISSANMTGTSAGQLSHANGFIMVPAPPAGSALILDGAYIAYTFGTAAYSGTGTNTIGVVWGGGGAALTGTQTQTLSVMAAGNTQNQFYPLTTAGVPTLSATSINLKLNTTVITNPGTATGTVAYTVWYSVVTPGF